MFEDSHLLDGIFRERVVVGVVIGLSSEALSAAVEIWSDATSSLAHAVFTHQMCKYATDAYICIIQ